jgi:hypothetical protein
MYFGATLDFDRASGMRSILQREHQRNNNLKTTTSSTTTTTNRERIYIQAISFAIAATHNNKQRNPDRVLA